MPEVKFLTYCGKGLENRIPEYKIRFGGQEVTMHRTFDVSFDELTFACKSSFPFQYNINLYRVHGMFTSYKSSLINHNTSVPKYYLIWSQEY